MNEKRWINVFGTNGAVEVELTDEEQATVNAARVASIQQRQANDAAAAARQLDLSELATAKATAAITAIGSDVADITTDLLTIKNATALQVRGIVEAMLTREKKARLREQVIIKALQRLIN